MSLVNDPTRRIDFERDCTDGWRLAKSGVCCCISEANIATQIGYRDGSGYRWSQGERERWVRKWAQEARRGKR